MDAHHTGLLPLEAHDPAADERLVPHVEAARRSLQRRLDGWMSNVDHVLKSMATEEASRRRR